MNWADIASAGNSGTCSLSVYHGLQTGDNETPDGSVTTSWALAPRCHYDGHHTIRRIHAKGSNGYVRREHGECIYCDRPYTRTIRWATKDAREWWEPVDDQETA